MFAIRSSVVRRFSVAARARRVLVAACLAGLASAAHAARPAPDRPSDADAASSLSGADARAIRGVLIDQLDAFGKDDARRAYGHATTETQRRFASPGEFLRMVRDEYPPVYRADGFAFARLRRVSSRWVQTVRVVDESGRVWSARFVMKRQRHAWKVDGCELRATSVLAA